MADKIEVVQSVQDLTNSVPLVANKRTFVRFHVRSSMGMHDTTARLRVEREGEDLALSLVPINPNGQITVRPSPNRAVRDDAFLFALPNGFLDGRVVLMAEVNPDGDPAEADFTNNTISTTVAFEPVPPQTLVLYSVGYEQAGRTYYPSDLDRTQLVSWLQRAFPIGNLQVVQRSYFAGRGLPTCGEVNAYLSAKRLWDLAYSGELPPNTRYYGMVDDAGGLMPGCAAGTPGFVASGPNGPPDLPFSWDTDGTYGDWYGAHELAHTWGRQHTELYPNDQISLLLTGDTAIFGFDSVTRDIYGPNWKDVMSFRPYLWVSDFTYEGLLDFYTSEVGAGGAATAQGASPTDRLLVVGTIDPVAKTVGLQPLFVLPDAGDVKERIPGDHAIVLRDRFGDELQRYPFTPQSGATEGDPAQSMRVLFINELVPFLAGTTRVDIEGPNGLRYSVRPGDHAPAVTLTAPNGGEALQGDTITVSWLASDADGDPLAFNVQYSADNGVTWEMIEQNLTAASVEVDPRNVPRGTQTLFRVWASDGINTASDESDAPSTVPNHVPTVRITQPSAPTTILVGQSLALSGEAFDIDTGTMSADHLEWRSNLDGPLGQGAAVTVSTLSLGVHTISFLADDGEDAASATVEVRVVDLCKCTPTTCDCPPVPDRLDVAPLLVSCDTAVSIGNDNHMRSIGWTADASAAWLDVVPETGHTPSEVTVRCNRAGTDAGTYATITFTSDEVEQSRTIGVEATFAALCAGDCNDDKRVAINELIIGVNIALENTPLAVCPSFDTNDSGKVDINELIKAVGNALNGCPS